MLPLMHDVRDNLDIFARNASRYFLDWCSWKLKSRAGTWTSLSGCFALCMLRKNILYSTYLPAYDGASLSYRNCPPA